MERSGINRSRKMTMPMKKSGLILSRPPFTSAEPPGLVLASLASPDFSIDDGASCMHVEWRNVGLVSEAAASGSAKAVTAHIVLNVITERSMVLVWFNVVYIYSMQ